MNVLALFHSDSFKRSLRSRVLAPCNRDNTRILFLLKPVSQTSSCRFSSQPPSPRRLLEQEDDLWRIGEQPQSRISEQPESTVADQFTMLFVRYGESAEALLRPVLDITTHMELGFLP